MPLDLQWDRTLRRRQGGAIRLAGIDVYYDFDWLHVFPDNRAQFRNGQCLANRVKDDCPAGKTPALLLTDRDEIKERAVETDEHYILILNLPRYLKVAEADAALSYLANAVGTGIARLGDVADLANTWTGDQLRAFFDLKLNGQHIAEWAGNNTARIEQLREIAAVEPSEASTIDVASVIAALGALGPLDPEILDAIAGVISPETDRPARLRLLRSLTGDPVGRHDTGTVFGDRAADRIADVRNVAANYRTLVKDPNSSETDLQRFIEQNPWLLGLDYAHIRPRRQIPRGIVDFLLERFDGFRDLLELKSPQDPIISAPEVPEVPPPASEYALSPVLAGALAQVHVYRDILTTDSDAARRLFGLEHTRDPQAIIVIGRAEMLPDYRQRVLRELNRSLHRVEVVPYDILAQRADAVLDNVERYVLAAADSEPSALDLT
ncbi:MAG TPA: Shedu anti-phage system protein SduA domain-containing protein [Solirubrobacteraceae bacterium]|nr:Shedu anti-phage system protein SduA domain-containing protein [Solirubrobacteraceae bacterium]